MAPSPQPSQLTRPSGDAFMAWSYPTATGQLSGVSSSAQPIALVQAALDHLGQLIFLAFVVSYLLRSEDGEPLDLLHHRTELVVCAFVLSLRLLCPLCATLYSAAIGFRQQQISNFAQVTILTLPALVVGLLVSASVLIAYIFGSKAAACTFLLVFVGLCLAVNTFVALRLIVIQQQGPSGALASPSARQYDKSKQRDTEGKKDDYLAATMSTAGTKASSANPYDARGKCMIIKEEDKPAIEGEAPGDILESDHSVTAAADDSISSLWLNQTVPLQRSGDVPHNYHHGSFDDETLLTPPPSASSRSLDGGAPVSPPETGLHRGGSRLRISPSAREIMVSLSTPLDFYEPVISFDLYFILYGLAGMWIVSILCIPLLVASIIYAQPTVSTQILTLCFIVGVAVSGPLIALQAFKDGRRSNTLPPSHRLTPSPLPRPSFASSLITGRTSKASNHTLSRECPVAGNGFEPVNGYDYPFSPHLPGSYDSDKRVRSVAYSTTHWNSGAVSGDRVTASQGVFGRAANMMSPKPKLQVLSSRDDGKGSSDTVASRISSKVSIGFEDDEEESCTTEAIVRDISDTSAIMPGAMPLSPYQDVSYHTIQSMQCERRINTIYEVDSSAARSTQASLDGSPGMSRGATRSIASPFQRFTTALRKRPATLSEADWVNVSPLSLGGSILAREERQRSSQIDCSSVSGQSLTVHRSSLSMSVVQERTGSFSGDAHELTSIPDASSSEADMADLSGLSSPSKVTTQARQGVVEGKVELNTETSKVGEGKGQAKRLHSEDDTHDDSPNWKVLGTPPKSGMEDVAEGDVDVSLISTRSLANVMGISEEEAAADNIISHSTPPRKGHGLSSSTGKTKEVARKSLCSEMGFTAASPAQGSSPCRTSSDCSSLHHRRMTADTISDSFMSSGVDEELIISPDVTPERIVEEERDIVVVEMDESLPMDNHSDEITADLNTQAVASSEYTFSTQRYYQEGGNYLDPVEEVTEEPTIPISEHDSPSEEWVCSDYIDNGKGISQDDQINNTKQRSLYELPNQQVSSSSTPVLRRNAAEEWARLHGFATPSSFASSPPSQFGWAEVIEMGKRTPSQQLSMQRRSRYSPKGSPPSSTSSPLGRGRLDSNLSAHTRAYLASQLSGTPSRLIGLHSKFWVTSPPSLALQSQKSGRKTKRGSLMIAMSPPSGLDEESSWVDGAIAEDEALCAERDMERCAKKWRRMSKSTVGGVEGSQAQGSPINSRTKGGRQRSGASLQSLIDAAVRRGSGAFKGSQQQYRTSSSNRSSLASQMTIPNIKISPEGGDRDSLGNRSDVKVVGSCISSPPSTPRRTSKGSAEIAEYASGKAPMKSGGTIKSMRNREIEQDSPSSGKRSMKVVIPSPSPNRRSPAGRSKRNSLGGKGTYKVHSRKESRVRETVKMLELSVRAAMEHHQVQQQETSEAADVLSPRKKVQPRELTVLPASPGKFRLQEANSSADEADKENSGAAPLLKRINRSSRFNLRRQHPQIFVRPPSGSSTHTQHLY